jgi:hypothetical protein
MPPHGALQQVASARPPRATGWTPQSVGAYLLAPVIGLLSGWLMRAPAPPPDAPTRAEVATMQARINLAEAEVAAARADCASARENASTARSRSAVAETIADSAVRPRER